MLSVVDFRSRRADQDDELAVADAQVEVVDRERSVGITLRYVVKPRFRTLASPNSAILDRARRSARRRSRTLEEQHEDE